MSSSGSSDSSLLIWLLAAALLLLACHVSLGWVRLVRERETLRQRLPGVLVAGALLGTALCSVIVLVLAGEPFPFPLGYRAVEAAPLAVGALLGGIVVCLLIDRCRRGWTLALCGVPLAALAVGVQMGWLHAVGFRPGIDWRPEFLTLAFGVATIAASCGLWLAYSELTRTGSQRTRWQLGATFLIGLGLMAAQELVLAAAHLSMQVGSVFRGEVPGTVLSLGLGLLLPLLLTMLAIDLAWRKSQRRNSYRSGGFKGSYRSGQGDGKSKRRRRHRTRTI
jgi:NO-binding membrane sensor protein with MHYT domain